MQDEERGLQQRERTDLEQRGGRFRTYGDPGWHRGTDQYGNPVWYRAYGWSYRGGDWDQESWGQRPDREPHAHGRTQSRHYQRSDERIREDVYDRLNDHPNLDSEDIRASVEQGEVILEGTVHDRREKRLAEDVAEAVSGVRDVQNRLRLQEQQRPGDQGSASNPQGQENGTRGEHGRSSPGATVGRAGPSAESPQAQRTSPTPNQ